MIMIRTYCQISLVCGWHGWETKGGSLLMGTTCMARCYCDQEAGLGYLKSGGSFKELALLRYLAIAPLA